MSEKQIGRVISVDNFRVFIRLDDIQKSSHKSGLHDIYDVARINSYLVIPVGSDRIIALITRVKMQEETEFDKNSQSITLPSSARYISATMLGTIETYNDKEIFIQGVYNFPVLDNPVWYVTAKDLDIIFDHKADDKIKFEKDYYLPIGKSPAFTDYDVKICPDQFFVKHGAVLGNTGSGKSCTIASILHSLFKHSFKIDSENKFLENAHFIIFDTNGEYKEAFDSDDDIFKRINAFHINEKGLKVPYWFMNWDDFDYLFEPGPGTQAPILKRAIGLAKNSTETTQNNISQQILNNIEINLLNSIINQIENKDLSEYWKIKNYADSINNLKNKNIIINTINLTTVLNSLPIPGDTDYKIPNTDTLTNAVQELRNIIIKNNEVQQNIQITNDKNIDLPVWFNYQELITTFISTAIDEQEGSNSRLTEYLSTLRLRLESFLNDKRIAEPLMLSSSVKMTDDLIKLLSFIIGDFFRFYNESDDDIFTQYYKNIPDDKLNKNNQNQISIIDLSLIPFDVLENITGLIGRLIIEFVSHFKPEDRGKYPIVLILEEAQNYIPEKNRKDKDSIARKVFERIAREGRKYGVSLIISSQRPYELSKTVLSQCNSFIVHRLQNPQDQAYIRGLVSNANSDILEQLPILPQQHAIIMGDCVRTPVQIKINEVNPRPKSNNPEFVKQWLTKTENFPDYKEICDRWQKGEK